MKELKRSDLEKIINIYEKARSKNRLNKFFKKLPPRIDVIEKIAELSAEMPSDKDESDIFNQLFHIQYVDMLTAQFQYLLRSLFQLPIIFKKNTTLASIKLLKISTENQQILDCQQKILREDALSEINQLVFQFKKELEGNVGVWKFIEDFILSWEREFEESENLRKKYNIEKSKSAIQCYMEAGLARSDIITIKENLLKGMRQIFRMAEDNFYPSQRVWYDKHCHAQYLNLQNQYHNVLSKLFLSNEKKFYLFRLFYDFSTSLQTIKENIDTLAAAKAIKFAISDWFSEEEWSLHVNAWAKKSNITDQHRQCIFENILKFAIRESLKNDDRLSMCSSRSFSIEDEESDAFCSIESLGNKKVEKSPSFARLHKFFKKSTDSLRQLSTPTTTIESQSSYDSLEPLHIA